MILIAGFTLVLKADSFGNSFTNFLAAIKTSIWLCSLIVQWIWHNVQRFIGLIDTRAKILSISLEIYIISHLIIFIGIFFLNWLLEFFLSIDWSKWIFWASCLVALTTILIGLGPVGVILIRIVSLILLSLRFLFRWLCWLSIPTLCKIILWLTLYFGNFLSIKFCFIWHFHLLGPCVCIIHFKRA